jgi:hypothetical protein
MCGSWNSEAVCSAFSSALRDEQGNRWIESESNPSSYLPSHGDTTVPRNVGTGLLYFQASGFLFRWGDSPDWLLAFAISEGMINNKYSWSLRRC